MIANVGGKDRIVRLIVGVALIAATLTGAVGWWGWLGLVAIGTAMFSFCPAYRLFGVSSCRYSSK